MKRVTKKLLEKPVNLLLSKFSGEFYDPELENDFLSVTWQDYKKTLRNTWVFGGLIFLCFAVVDCLAENDFGQLMLTLSIRIFAALFLIGSALYFHQKKEYFTNSHLLTLANQILIAVAVIYIGKIRDLVFIHNAFHVFMATLIYYQFLYNKFYNTIIACAFFPVAYLLANLGQLEIGLTDIIRFNLYIVMANGLGITMLSALNKNRRKQYIQFIKEQYLNSELQLTVDKLISAQQEIKTLEGIIPICSNCKKIRDDEGYWKKIESYIESHLDASFSHGICPECMNEFYGDKDWYKKRKKKDQDNKS